MKIFQVSHFLSVFTLGVLASTLGFSGYDERREKERAEKVVQIRKGHDRSYGEASKSGTVLIFKGDSFLKMHKKFPELGLKNFVIVSTPQLGETLPPHFAIQVDQDTLIRADLSKLLLSGVDIVTSQGS